MFVFRLDDFYALLWLVLSSCFHIFFRISSRLKLFLTNLISNSKITCQLLAIWSVIPYKLTPHTHTHTHTHTRRCLQVIYWTLIHLTQHLCSTVTWPLPRISSSLIGCSGVSVKHQSESGVRWGFFLFSETGRSATWEGRRVSRR